MTIAKCDVRILRIGNIIRLKNELGAPWWYVKDIKDGVITLEENTMFYLNEKKIKINPRRKRYVFLKVEL